MGRSKFQKTILKIVTQFFCLLLFLTLTSLFLTPTPALAESQEFSTRYDVAYDVNSDGTTQVTQKITLKNLTSAYYVSNFTLTIGSTTLTDVVASDQQGPMETKVESADAKTSISTKFNSQIAGIGKEQTFTIKFKSKDFAQALGKTWEVNLPRIPSQGNITSYNLTLSVPISFGDPTSISPNPKSSSSNFDRLFFNFDKSQLEKSGVSVNFGTTQIFDFNIKYPLENTSLFPVLTSVTLPSDNNYQDVSISRVTPLPLNVTIDADGNYLAWYRLKRGDKIEVNVAGSAQLYIKSKIKQVNPLSPEQTKTYTASDRYWERDNPTIANLVKTIINDAEAKTNHQKVEAIYRYVVNNLRYSTKRLNDNNIERLGAITALNNLESAVCMEFTDLFIALTRSAGIPAREVDGFAYTQNQNLRPLSLAKNLLHAWPEYWDETSGWVMVDPTWENTSGGVDYFNKFDLNHLSLVTKGYSSESPAVSSDVTVNLSGIEISNKPQIQILIEPTTPLIAGLPSKLQVKIINQGQVIFPGGTLNIITNKTNILNGDTVNLGPIPPLGTTSLSFNLRTPFDWNPYEELITAKINDQKQDKRINIKPIVQGDHLPYVAGGIGLLIVITYFGVLGLHIHNKRRKI